MDSGGPVCVAAEGVEFHDTSLPRPPGRPAGVGCPAGGAGCAQRHGHEEAFAELYDRTATRIHGVALRVLRSADHAAEVTQEVFVEVWRQAARYSSEKGSVMAWMTTMAHRRAVDRVRSVSSEAARDERYAAATADRPADYVWAGVEQRLDVERVRTGMAS